MNAIEFLIAIPTGDATSNLFGKTEVEREEALGKLITGSVLEEIRFLTAKYYVGTAIVELFRGYKGLTNYGVLSDSCASGSVSNALRRTSPLDRRLVYYDICRHSWNERV